MSTASKIGTIVLKIITWALIVFAATMMIFTIVTVTTVDKNDRGMFGFRFYIVRTDSMSLSENNADLDIHFNAGDIVIVKKAKDPKKLEPNTVISFMSANSDNFGETVTHMIRSVERDKDGNVVGYVTYGTNTGVDDEAIVEPSYILGVYSGKVPKLGNLFAFVKSTPGYILCILIPFLLLILYNGINVIRLFRKYKGEQNAIIEAERAEIAAERKQNEEMMRELLEMKARLERQASDMASNENKTDSDKSDKEEGASETE